MKKVVHFEIPADAYVTDSEGNLLGLWEDIKQG